MWQEPGGLRRGRSSLRVVSMPCRVGSRVAKAYGTLPPLPAGGIPSWFPTETYGCPRPPIPVGFLQQLASTASCVSNIDIIVVLSVIERSPTLW